MPKVGSRVYSVQRCIPPAHALPLSCPSQLSWLFPPGFCFFLFTLNLAWRKVQLSWSSAPFHFLLFQLPWSPLKVVSLCSSLSPEEGVSSGSCTALATPPLLQPHSCLLLFPPCAGSEPRGLPQGRAVPAPQPSLAPPRAPCRILCFTCSLFVLFLYIRVLSWV